VVGSNDNGERGACTLWGGPQYMRQQRLAGDGMQHLRYRGLHPHAFAGREYDREAGSAGHVDSLSSATKLRRRRHKAFPSAMETAFVTRENAANSRPRCDSC
jgi:hypothetical protein